ncbi:mycothiol synthase [Demetria terragena]|uniref:mycothiol synthase n=1 Tax=Demetria terragena TaxID=63959 RepID=UPI00036B6BE0|nr:mycothiol synthase [Demetria terragena]
MSDTLPQQVEALAAAVHAVDGVAAFGEQPLLALRRNLDHPEAVMRTRSTDAVLVAAAIWPDDDPDSVEVAVHPDHRRQGFGGSLVREILQERPAARFWAHGKLPAAQSLAEGAGLEVVRELWRMERPLAAGFNAEPALPTGFVARAFQAGQDEDAWLRVNARAFVNHPEQGRMNRADLEARMGEDWFDPDGLILIEDAATGSLAASHWTKIPADSPATGEVYVVAVDPDFQGRGLARPLTALGLAHLAGRGVSTVELYVEADNDPAVATYRKIGFEPAAVDAMFAPTSA